MASKANYNFTVIKLASLVSILYDIMIIIIIILSILFHVLLYINISKVHEKHSEQVQLQTKCV